MIYNSCLFYLLSTIDIMIVVSTENIFNFNSDNGETIQHSYSKHGFEEFYKRQIVNIVNQLFDNDSKAPSSSFNSIIKKFESLLEPSEYVSKNLKENKYEIIRSLNGLISKIKDFIKKYDNFYVIHKLIINKNEKTDEENKVNRCLFGIKIKLSVYVLLNIKCFFKTIKKYKKIKRWNIEDIVASLIRDTENIYKHIYYNLQKDMNISNGYKKSCYSDFNESIALVRCLTLNFLSLFFNYIVTFSRKTRKNDLCEVLCPINIVLTSFTNFIKDKYFSYSANKRISRLKHSYKLKKQMQKISKGSKFE